MIMNMRRVLFTALSYSCLVMAAALPSNDSSSLHRQLAPLFPADFAWGAATASYQIEGAVATDGRSASIWDTFAHTPGKTANGDTGDVADDSYHRFKEDVDLAADMGITHYRMSISWSRILPSGDFPVNPKGIAFYNAVINYVLSKGIEPLVTLYHWDLPQILEDEFGGWLDEKIIKKFVKYSATCFLAFGDRVKYWLTFNEPLTFTNLGYSVGMHAPGRCSDRSKCTSGDSSTEPYIVAHNVLRSHARAVEMYRILKETTPGMLKGEIGITLNCDWGEPLSDSPEDKEASNRYHEFQLGWWADPVFFGKYPDSMVKNVGERLPVFTEEESNLLKGSWDFFGLNHYTSQYVYKPDYPSAHDSWFTDHGVGVTHTSKDGQLIGPQGDSNWLYVVPWGFKKMLEYVAERYGNPGIFVTENGCDVPNESKLPVKEALNDQFRINYYREYIANMLKAMAGGVHVRGYFAWSLLDNFEWADGYDMRFGLHYVDYKNNRKRYKKASATWYKNYIAANSRSKIHGKLRIRPIDEPQGGEPVMGSPSPPSVADSSDMRMHVVSGVVGFMGALAMVLALFIGRTYYHRHHHSMIMNTEADHHERDGHGPDDPRTPLAESAPEYFTSSPERPSIAMSRRLPSSKSTGAMVSSSSFSQRPSSSNGLSGMNPPQRSTRSAIHSSKSMSNMGSQGGRMANSRSMGGLATMDGNRAPGFTASRSTGILAGMSMSRNNSSLSHQYLPNLDMVQDSDHEGFNEDDENLI